MRVIVACFACVGVLPAHAENIATYNWTGFYLGAHGGYGAGRDVDVDPRGRARVRRVNGVDDFAGGFGGVQFGYNWHGAPGFVFGVEIDVSAGDIGGDLAVPIGGGLPRQTFASKIDFFGTARGRVGYAFERMLLYGTAGFAGARKELVTQLTLGTVGGGGLTLPAFADSKFRTGWTAGGGFEWGLAPQWTVKTEYLYARLGSENYFGPMSPSGPADLHLFKFGVNYRFGAPAAVIAKY